MEEKEFIETIGELAKIIEMMKLKLQDEELATLPKTKEALERIVKDFERLKKILIEEKELMIE
jgi:Asp-tRNA(Asn)/Glu-tRNA(Gln) amidotransferase C subunit